MTFKELFGHINEELDTHLPGSGCTIITSKPDTDVDSVFDFDVQTILNNLVGTLNCDVKAICALPVDSDASLSDILDVIISAVALYYRPTAEGYVVGEYPDRGVYYMERPVVVFVDENGESTSVAMPIVAREYHRVEVPVAFHFELIYAVTEEPSEDDGGGSNPNPDVPEV